MRFGHVLVLALLAQGCVHVSANLYEPEKTYPPVAPANVRVFWTQPPFEVIPIGEMQIKPCPACSDDKIAGKVRPKAGAVGADTVVIVDESRRVAGVQMIGNTAHVYQKRRLIAIMGKRQGSAP
jgi:hypothetical protein